MSGFQNISDVQRVVIKEEVLPEQQERSSSPNQEEPLETVHIKRELEDQWNSRELQGPEEDDIIMFTFDPALVKSEEDDGEELQSSRLHENQSEEDRYTAYLKTEANGEDCGGPEADRDFNPDCYLQSVTLDETSNISVCDTDDSGDWEESDEPQEGLNPLQNNDLAVSDIECNTGNSSVSSSECAPSLRQKKRHKKPKGSHTGEKLFSCSVCGKRYPGEKNLQQHMLRHSGEKPFSCSVCNKNFLWRAEMVTHMRTHTGEKPFSCSVCGKRFSLHGNLRQHALVHTGEKQFSCSVCGKIFLRSGHLKRHFLVHTGEKPFSCSVCGKRFSLCENLRKHSIVHTGQKQFTCPDCGRTFSQQVHLKQHSVIHTGEKPFSCQVCDRKFTKMVYVNKHKCVGKTDKNK
ncbi:zinc finger protein OZF-like [Cheilinus undulatus]|uniref:zinc finger protein OZF-like n=1 Tax=Cheilinus undulatus TaxID=241271 RepID=UPI001BD586BE|nr:zinc finger protein OZF-like [Cheilinus undulatus]